ncbi:hypothetical protein [Nonomuraea composti]|uniref:hypothetical protein n=1 Tax=Nonomuraea composti TaxID=2720023 RepID=UPI001F0CF982|nr:hypothetical protein [Nonomuraea sp. FMUSA5-5]
MSDITEPPIARVDVVRETLHGITLEDPYRWMEAGGEEFHRWLDGQARHAREHLDALPHRSGLLARIRELGGALMRYFGLAMAAGRVFALVREPGARVPVLTVTEAGGVSRVLFDPGAVRGDGPHAIDWYVPSPDGNHVACAVSAPLPPGHRAGAAVAGGLRRRARPHPARARAGRDADPAHGRPSQGPEAGRRQSGRAHRLRLRRAHRPAGVPS